MVEGTEAFFAKIGKITICVQKKVSDHVANRLQVAVWRKAIHLVQSGVASVGDVDKAMPAGPGLRWVAMGSTTLFRLGAGPCGLAVFCQYFANTFNGWWEGLDTPRLDAETTNLLVDGLDNATAGASVGDLNARRDAMIVALRKSHSGCSDC